MIVNKYAKAAEYWNNSLEEILDNDRKDPWKNIEEELQCYFLKDKEALDSLLLMSERLMVSMVHEINKIEDTTKGQLRGENYIHKVVIAVVSTALLRAFAVGAMSQRTYDEIGKLEALLESN